MDSRVPYLKLRSNTVSLQLRTGENCATLNSPISLMENKNQPEAILMEALYRPVLIHRYANVLTLGYRRTKIRPCELGIAVTDGNERTW